MPLAVKCSSSWRTPSTSATADAGGVQQLAGPAGWRVELAGIGPAVVERGQKRLPRDGMQRHRGGGVEVDSHPRNAIATRTRPPQAGRTTHGRVRSPALVRLAVRRSGDGLHGAAKEAGAGGLKRFEPRARRRARRLGRRGDDPARRVLRRTARSPGSVGRRASPSRATACMTCGSGPWSRRSSSVSSCGA